MDRDNVKCFKVSGRIEGDLEPIEALAMEKLPEDILMDLDGRRFVATVWETNEHATFAWADVRCHMISFRKFVGPKVESNSSFK